jgi:hypothetical protein
MQRRVPLRQTGWRRTAQEKKGAGLAQRIAQSLGMGISHRRAAPSVFRSEDHLRAVATLPCACCGRPKRSQAAHVNLQMGQKGMGIKASDALTFPLCADGFLVLGCHSRLDQGGIYDKATSAAMQIRWLEKTRDRLRQLGQWPEAAERDFQRFIVAYLERQE